MLWYICFFKFKSFSNSNRLINKNYIFANSAFFLLLKKCINKNYQCLDNECNTKYYSKNTI